LIGFELYLTAIVERNAQVKSKISALIIDRECANRDYSKIVSNYGGIAEDTFDLRVTCNCDHILEDMGNHVETDCIVTIGDIREFGTLNGLPFLIRKKWVHLDDYDPALIANSIIATLSLNMRRNDCDIKLFSFFTCTFNTGIEKLTRLYDSIKAQTYTEWNWFILDDSPNDDTIRLINSFKDARITVVKNVTVHGNIGFNKHNIAMMCTGDYLVEVDHDDELLPDCLEYLDMAFKAYPDAGFAYSRALELKGEKKIPIIYGEGWGFGEGLTCSEFVNGVKYTFSETPGVNPFSIRTIYAQPNHVRCWKRKVYHEIGGHDVGLSVLDDMELIIRTFLATRMIQIPKVLYLQYEGDGERGVGTDNTQSVRFKEIQRSVWIIKDRYDKLIHERILSLGFKDTPWVETLNASNLNLKHEKGKETMSYLYRV